ncbi:MAG: DUF2523 family protein [Acidovorax sp.]|uniref:DUF2523 family protein n=1 Tax=Acidovorax sp. TaxID=1872122 RepID=UPI0039E470E2
MSIINIDGIEKMKIGTWLLGMMQPLLARILTSLGFSVVTITGFEVAVGQVKTMIQSNVGSLPVDVLNLFLLGGGGVGLGIILGAITTKIMLWQIQSATQILGKNPG